MNPTYRLQGSSAENGTWTSGTFRRPSLAFAWFKENLTDAEKARYEGWVLVQQYEFPFCPSAPEMPKE